MEAFAQFASDLDQATQRLLARGARLTQLLKQPQYSPLAVEEQVLVIFAGTKGYLDGIAVNDVSTYEQALLTDAHANAKDILKTIREKKKLDDDLEKKMKDYLQKFTDSFAPTAKAA